VPLKRWFWPVLAIFSLSLAAWLAEKVFDYKGRLWARRVHSTPTYLGEVVPPASASGKKFQVWLLGDSRFAGLQPENPGLEVQVVNRAVGGSLAGEITHFLEQDLKRGGKPDLAIIQCGINDIASAGYDKPAMLPGASNRAFLAIQRQRDLLQAVGARVIITTVFPRGPLHWREWGFWTGEMDNSITDLNARLAGLDRPECQTLDLVGQFSQNGKVIGSLSLDTLHLNAAGNAKLEGILGEAIRSSFGSGR
jgi:lysophospholipase L1-like esterase